MGREVRRVPENWQHPQKPDGSFIPLHGGSFAARLAEWERGAALWEQGLRDDFNGGTKSHGGGTYEDWDGERPVESNYMPDWPEDQRTHWQMYEDTTEGTPISPVMESPEALARWLADNGASAFAGLTATYDQWLSTIRRGHACSAIVTERGMTSGVAGLDRMERNP